uniref:Uncharacterized protein n=1 Tax=Gouania willdenowi TaxID=441366 RepID=A0A8C5I3H4_GOUWI
MLTCCFKEIQKLNLSMNCLCSLSPAVGSLDNLVVLNLWGNNLSSLPPEIGQLKKLEHTSIPKDKYRDKCLT